MPRIERAAGFALLATGGLLLLFFLNEHVHLAKGKEYSIDEFQYVHGGWRISQGDVIYRDFFEHHHPLVHQLVAGAFLALDDDPMNVGVLRFLMLPFLLLTLFAAWRIAAGPSQGDGERDGGRWAILAPLFVLMVPSFSMMATEIRPDPLAFALFLSAVAVLYAGRLDPRLRGFLSGLLVVAAFWGTLKVVYYGLVFPAALVADLVALRRRSAAAYLLGHPLFFLAGCAAAALPIAVYLAVTSSFGAWFEWCIQWSFVHQKHYPGFFWTRNFASLFAHSFWLFPFAVAGVMVTVRRRPGAGSPELLLLGSLVTTLASFVWQSAAYLYSLVPFTVLWCLFAARGAAAAVRLAKRTNEAAPYLVALLVLLFAVELGRARTGLEKLAAATNDAQHALLRRVGDLTRPGEPVFNISGGQVTRPSVHFFYFFEAVVRQLKHDVFAYEIPHAMMERGTVAYMPSGRFGRLPVPLRQFLLESFQPYDAELWFWGRRYAAGGEGELRGDFPAVRDGRYFVWPLDAPQRGELTVGGRRVEEPVLELVVGSYPVVYRGPAAEIFLVWLPADGHPFAPRPELQPGLEGF